jgi:predicted dehydrogenase
MSIAVIGAGNFGKNHVRTLHQLGVLSAVAEASAKLREQLAADYPGLRVHDSHQRLLEDPGISAVTIATPAHTHHEIAKAFMEAGKDVLVEKPMALTVADAKDLQRTAEKHGRILMVGHLLMHQPAVKFIHDFLKAGSLGKVFTLHQERAKLGKVRAVENALWSLGVHDVAVLLHLVGEQPDHVSAFGHRGLQPNIEDDLYVHLSFPSGIKATLHNSWLWPEDSRILRVIGEKGMVVYHEKENKVTLFRKTVDGTLNHTDDKEGEVLFHGAAEPLKLELQHFLDCVKHRSTPISDGRNGIEVIRVLEGAAASRNDE